MGVELVTKEDLQELRLQLLTDKRELPLSKVAKVSKPWLRNSDLRNLLGLFANTIQRLGITGKLRSTKLGGVHYYRDADIDRLMSKGE